MAVITDIQLQKRTPGRYSVYLDNQYSFSLTDLELSGSSLRIGQKLTAAEAEAWHLQSVEGKAYNLALGYLSYRPRSQREMTDYLARKGYEVAVAEPVIKRLAEYGFIDDAAFAASWIANRQALKPRSRRMLEQELLHKGIDRQVVAEALEELGDEAQTQALTRLIEARRRQERYRNPDTLMQYLARQGFRYDQIKKALERLDD